MLQTAASLITRADYQTLPEGPPHYQVIEGDLLMSPSPNTFHQQIHRRILTLIEFFLEKNPLGEVFGAPFDVFLTETNIFQPDILFVSNANRSRITSEGMEGAPDLIIEILSPRTALYDRGAKRKIYARTGVQELWLVDPEKRAIEVFHLPEDAERPRATHARSATFGSPLLPGLKFRCDAIFK